MFERIGCVVNPAAGGGRIGETIDHLRRIFRSKGVEASIQESRSANHATEAAREFAAEYDVVAAVGGDGTVNRVANGVIGSKAAFSVIPNGSGNDFASLLAMPRDRETACEAILRGRVKRFDVGRVRTDSSPEITHFVNTLGIGFDASVAYEAHRIPLLKGLPLYLAGLAGALMTFRTVNFQIDDESGHGVNKECFLVCVANGEREGGGFRIAPEANPTDGVFDVCVIGKLPLRRILSVVRAVLAGKHAELSEVHYFKARNVRVRTAAPVRLHADGEVHEGYVREVNIELNPGALRVITAEA